MSRKNINILLSILHMCVFFIGILTIYHNMNATAHPSVAVVPENTILTADTATEIETETETDTEFIPAETLEIENLEIETLEIENLEIENLEMNTSETETMAAPETETAGALAAYTFQYTGGIRNLNIRKGPSIDDEIIGRIPPNDGGTVLELTDEKWALIEYRGITGYCSLEWMMLTPTDARP